MAESTETTFEYDIAFSFAGEQRTAARQVALILQNAEAKIFYDEFREADLWGKDLAEYLAEVYYKKARYCVMFISRAYAAKMWPTLERRQAIARAVAEKNEYILPVRFDDTELPGLPETVCYVQWTDADDLVALILEKLGIRLQTTGRNTSGGSTLDASLRSFLEGVSRYSSFNIIVIGKAGVGKSSLINYLFSKQVRGVGVGVSHTAMGFHKEDMLLRGVPVTLFDSGGLEVANVNQWQKGLDHELKQRGDSVPPERWIHTVIYCISAGSSRVDPFEVELIRDLVDRKLRVIVALTKADQASEGDRATLRETILIEVGTRLPCISVCCQEVTPVPGITIPRFGLENLLASIVSGFWESIRLRLPRRCIALLEEAIDYWAGQQKGWIEENVGYFNKSEGVAHVNTEIATFIATFTRDTMPRVVADEVVRTLNMFGSITRMFGLVFSSAPVVGSMVDDSFDFSQVQGELLSGIMEIVMDIALFPFSLLLVGFRGSFNRFEVEDYLKKVVAIFKGRLQASEPAIANVIGKLVKGN